MNDGKKGERLSEMANKEAGGGNEDESGHKRQEDETKERRTRSNRRKRRSPEAQAESMGCGKRRTQLAQNP